jgi:hypothetical protein
MLKRTCLAVILLAAVALGCDSSSAPRTFDDCILMNMRGVTSDTAAAAIRRSCREKFSEARAP